MADYGLEREELDSQIAALETDLRADDSAERDTKAWAALIKDCVAMEKLDRETAVRLIECITVKEKEMAGGTTNQTISIRYRFVGRLGQ